MLHEGKAGWLLRQLRGVFTVLVFAPDGQLSVGLDDALRVLQSLPLEIGVVIVSRDAHAGSRGYVWLCDASGLAATRYAPDGAALYLLRPDQLVAGRRHGLGAAWLGEALRRAAQTELSYRTGRC